MGRQLSGFRFRSAGFTLVELLAVMGILLATVVPGVVSRIFRTLGEP
ncbi:MAG: type II secretion system protein [Verrucomicrobia bacterium]|nr:MAG: type II secretion system protein [Verrucomicrobiota bacterium]